jgi:hypothetical protein
MVKAIGRGDGADDNLRKRWLGSHQSRERLVRSLRLGERLERLLAVGFCRQIWGLFTDSRSQEAVETAEMYADGENCDDGLDEAADSAEQAAFAGETGWPTVAWPQTPEMVVIADEDGDRVYRRDPAIAPGDGRSWHADTLPVAAEAAAQWAVALDTVDACVYAAINAEEAAALAAATAGWEQQQTDELAETIYRATVSYHRHRQARLLAAVVGPGWEFKVDWFTDGTVALARHCYDHHGWSLMPVLADALEKAGCKEGALGRPPQPAVGVVPRLPDTGRVAPTAVTAAAALPL